MNIKQESPESKGTVKIEAEPIVKDQAKDQVRGHVEGIIVEPNVKVEPTSSLTLRVSEFLTVQYPMKSPRKTIASAVITVKTGSMHCLKISQQPDWTYKATLETRFYFGSLEIKMQSRLYRAVLKTGPNDSSGVAWIRFTT